MTSEIDLIKICKELASSIEHSGATLFDHLYGCWNLAKENKYDDIICNALLFHSVYGTTSFDVDALATRNEVQYWIGKEAENLVYEFSTLPHRTDMILNVTWNDEETRYKLAQMDYINILEQKSRFPSEMQFKISETLFLYEKLLKFDKNINLK
jgi:hypothetical protein